MSKYKPLGMYLENCRENIVSLTFAEIESILGFSLPVYMLRHAACWYGTAEASPTHVAKGVWCSHGYQVDTLDLIAKTVAFKKTN